MFATPSIVAWFWNSGYGRTFCLLAIAVCGIYARAVYMKEVDFDLSESLRFFSLPCVCVLLGLELALLRRWPNVSRTASEQDVRQLHARASLGRTRQYQFRAGLSIQISPSFLSL